MARGARRKSSPRIRVKVAQAQSFPRYPPKSRRVVEQAPQSPGAAFGRLIKQQQAALVIIRQGLRSQLAIFQLELHLDGILQRGFQRGHGGIVQRFGRLKEQAVAPVFHIRDHARRARTRRVIRAGCIVGLLIVPRPIAALQVEQEAILLGIGAPGPTQVDAPECRRLAVG